MARFIVSLMVCLCFLWWQHEEKVEVEYISEKVEVDANGNMNPLVQDYLEVFEKFAIPEQMFLEATKARFFFSYYSSMP